MSSTYPNTIFVNIPVTDLVKSVAFYTAIGFTKNNTFSSPEAATMSLPPTPSSTGKAVHEGGVKICLLTHPFYDQFLPSGTERGDPRKAVHCIICLSKESKEAIDETAEKAAASGGAKDIREKSTTEMEMEKAGMYGRVLSDPDGHVVETVYMPPEGYMGKE